MNHSIKDYILFNFQGDDFDTLKRALEEAVSSQEETFLPGLGIFFSILWENGNQEMRNEMIEVIRKRVQKGLEENL